MNTSHLTRHGWTLEPVTDTTFCDDCGGAIESDSLVVVRERDDAVRTIHLGQIGVKHVAEKASISVDDD